MDQPVYMLIAGSHTMAGSEQAAHHPKKLISLGRRQSLLRFLKPLREVKIS